MSKLERNKQDGRTPRDNILIEAKKIHMIRHLTKNSNFM